MTRPTTNADPTRTTTTSTRTTKQQPKRAITSQKHEPQAQDQKQSHLCITIRGWRPASGRPAPALRATTTAVALLGYRGWTSWC